MTRHTVWACHYNATERDPSAKPTDLWGRFPDGWTPRPPCHNARPEHPADCCCRDHEPARRGAKTGTQGKRGAALRAVVPYGLGASLADALPFPTSDLNVLDLFAGLGGWSVPFLDLGADVFTVDLDPRFGCDLTADVANLTPDDLPWRPDVVLASPPCETFSVASIGTHWAGGWRAYEPRTEKAAAAIELVRRTVKLLHEIDAPVMVVENPRGVLRKLDTGLDEL